LASNQQLRVLRLGDDFAVRNDAHSHANICLISGHNNITGTGAAAIAKALKSGQQLEQLWLGNVD
jgi:hypothetical protein